MSLPTGAIPPGQTGCHIDIHQSGSSGAHGFSLDDVVYDVKIICDSGELNILLAPATICIQPHDGSSAGKQVFHSHNGGNFTGLQAATGPAGYVCGQTRIFSLFTLGQLALPATGFAPGVVTALAQQPAELAYAASDLVLIIPKLGVHLDVVGVPLLNANWDVSWLSSQQAGYLYGTAFPTWQGNSALTAHVWNADNTPGPFHSLKDLRYGDRFTVTAWGVTYVYEVRSNQLVHPGSLGVMGSSDYNEITLLTCESFSVATGDYLYRRAVQAVLVAVE
ncbi:MAG: sortase [Anaerolineales bacterium]|nr:sortase [Anaerolineales bacterium]